MVPLRALPTLLISLTVLAVVAWVILIGWSSGSLYAADLRHHHRPAAEG
jgi:hypothetical protein